MKLRQAWSISCVAWVTSCITPEPESFLERETTKPMATAAPAEAPPTPVFLAPTGITIPAAPNVYGELTEQGRELYYWVLGSGDKNILIFGGIHGNEQSSTGLAYLFLAWLLNHPEAVGDRRIVLAPLVNPDGYFAKSRENTRGVDLNRNFPAANWIRGGRNHPYHRPGMHPRSEPETRFLLTLMSLYPPDRAVAIHSAAACVNWDGPARDLAIKMSEQCGLPTKASIGYPTPGSFGSYLGIERSTPTITLELDHHQIISHWDGLRNALLSAVHYPDAVPATGGNAP